MKQPVIYLTLEEVLRIHAYQIEQFGGDRSVLDIHKVESAIAMPAQSFGGELLHGDIASMAAAYLYHLVQNHPFADGNKRTGMHAALVFLDLNGYDIEVPVDEAEQLVLSIAKGESNKEQAATLFRRLIAQAER